MNFRLKSNGEYYYGTQCELENLLIHLYNQGCETVILGCTELGSVYEYLDNNYPVIDSLECLANATVKLIKHSRNEN